MDTIYIENEIAEHPRARRILKRFPRARRIPIKRYGDVFNAPMQNFRAQKRNPALILAGKHGRRVHPTPPEYHIGGRRNFYFSHMLNCVYDCRYCFLQGMYRSANHVVFVNHEDFFRDIAATSREATERAFFFSGYECDSLALDPVTGFVDSALDAFAALPEATLEIRTKSTQIRPLLRRKALTNVVVAFSLSPTGIAANEEQGAPSLAKRLDALTTLQEAGWLIGLRFDPLLLVPDFATVYGDFFDAVAARLDMTTVHSVSIGEFRLPTRFHRRLVRLYPDARLLAAPMNEQNGLVSYPVAERTAMREFCLDALSRHIRDDQLFPCS
ncbi:MAG: DNA photolyase [Gammaproteobacteria bacterium]|nr:MAG: DNA photolyase [Gammaproteobacteria bacterium]